MQAVGGLHQPNPDSNPDKRNRIKTGLISELYDTRINTGMPACVQEFLRGIEALFVGIKKLPIEMRSAPSSQLLQLLDSVTLTLFPEGITITDTISKLTPSHHLWLELDYAI